MGGGVCENCGILFWEAPKSLPTVTAAIKLKDTGSLEGKVWPLLFKTGSLKTRRRHRACVSKMRWVLFCFFSTEFAHCSTTSSKRDEESSDNIVLQRLPSQEFRCANTEHILEDLAPSTGSGK